MSQIKAVGAVQATVQVRIKAPRDRVWSALIEETGEWWLKDFYALATTEQFVLESRLGGRVYEDTGNETGGLWYTVNSINPPESLHLVGYLKPPYGGPSISLLGVSLASHDPDETTVRVVDDVFGVVDQETVRHLEEGWRSLFEAGLKNYVEKKSK